MKNNIDRLEIQYVNSIFKDLSAEFVELVETDDFFQGLCSIPSEYLTFKPLNDAIEYVNCGENDFKSELSINRDDDELKETLCFFHFPVGEDSYSDAEYVLADYNLFSYDFQKYLFETSVYDDVDYLPADGFKTDDYLVDSYLEEYLTEENELKYLCGEYYCEIDYFDESLDFEVPDEVLESLEPYVPDEFIK